jgi:sialate O-acetylesterase
MRFRSTLTWLCLALFPAAALFAGPAENLKLGLLFGDNMVLQREAAIPIWGTAVPGGKLVVSLGKEKKKAKVGKDSTWKVTLSPLPAGGPYELLVIGKDTLRFKNVLVGEVWLASGQSNMEMPVLGDWAKVNNCDQETSAANYPNIRLFKVKHATSHKPQDTLGGEGWKVCGPGSVAGFSAAAYFFGRNLHQQLHVPVGLVQSAWGGTIIEAWTSGPALKTIPALAHKVTEYETTVVLKDEQGKSHETRLREWNQVVHQKDLGYMGTSGVSWEKPACDTTGWEKVQIPYVWDKSFDGVIWYRKTVMLPPGWPGRDLTLLLGPLDDSDTTWFNGTVVGTGDKWNVPRRYTVPGTLAQEGANTIIIRIKDEILAGGFGGQSAEHQLIGPTGDSLPLAGEWLCKTSLDFKQLPKKPQRISEQNQPTALFNAMINPLIPFALRGAIWYQGESNAGNGKLYQKLFPLMIQDWRTRWQQDDFPFLFVQLANYRDQQKEPVENSGWAELREAQLLTLSVAPHTGMAVASDIGDAQDIHPKNKQAVGDRLALVARHLVFQDTVAYSGPICKAMSVEGNRVRLTFEHATGGLTVKDNAVLQGFAVAGTDKVFYWADAVIENNTVVVGCDKVPAPTAVRYGWANNPVGNLYNQAQLPASPFRTDVEP